MDFLANFQTITSRRQIAAIAGVSERTAQRWLSGKSKPKKSAMELLLLHDNGRVMPQKWNKQMRFNTQGYLETGYKSALTWQQVDWYFYSLTCWHQLLDLLPRIEARLDALMKVCPPAEVINLQTYKDEIQRLKNRPFAMPQELKVYYELEPKQIMRKVGC